MRLAINGYGRVGRNILRAVFTMGLDKQFQIVAVNDLADNELMCHLTRYDSTFGSFEHDVHYRDDTMQIEGQTIALFSQADPVNLPWGDLGVDICLECSGYFAKRDLANKHIVAGAKKVLVSQPCSEADNTIVYGVNHQSLTADSTIVSNASCTTNCLAPLLSVLQKTVGIESGMMTTIHAYTNDQNLLDVASGDVYRSRCATQSMIPTRTGAANAIGLVIPELEGKLHGMAIRIPTTDVSLVDFIFTPQQQTSIEALHQAIQQAANAELEGILAYNEKPLVSIDFKAHPASSIFDANHTAMMGKQIKVMCWYDNEWAFSLRMLDVAREMNNQN